MASNQTQHLKLCQWEAEDEVLRADFNADNAKLDAAVASAAAAAEAAYSPEHKPFAAGIYTGNGAETQFISLGFTPSAVLVVNTSGFMAYRHNGSDLIAGGLAVAGGPTKVAEVAEGGFKVFLVSNIVSANNANGKYYYIALR